MKEKWLNKLQARIQSEYEAKAPEGLLDDIKKEMNRRGVAPVHSTRQKAKIVPLWIYRSASVAVMIAVGLCLGDMFVDQSSLPKQVATVLDNNVVSNSSMTETSANKHVSSIVKLVSSILKDTQLGLNDKTLLACNSNDSTKKEIGSDDKAIGSRQTTCNPSQKTAESTGNSQTIKQQSWGNLGTDNTSYAPNNTRSSRFSIGTSYNNASGISINAQRPLLEVANPYGEYDPKFSGDNIKDPIMGSEDIRINAKHHQPVKFGISVRYNLSSRWSLQTGLTYSYLASEFLYSKETESYVVEQNLHYVGLPVSASYSLVKVKRFNVYITVCGEIEKLVKGELKQAVGDVSKENPKDSAIKEGIPVFSVNAAIGGEYRFSKDISAYIEPGVSRHFNNGSTVESIYKDKPTNFNLNIGIRVNLNK